MICNNCGLDVICGVCRKHICVDKRYFHVHRPTGEGFGLNIKYSFYLSYLEILMLTASILFICWVWLR